MYNPYLLWNLHNSCKFLPKLYTFMVSSDNMLSVCRKNRGRGYNENKERYKYISYGVSDINCSHRYAQDR